MELLEKITLYDLLGYTLPGCILLYVLGVFETPGSEAGFFSVLVFIVIGYVTGILISEASAWLTGGKIISEKLRRTAEKKIKPDPETVKRALMKANVLPDPAPAADMDLVWNYFAVMYADIQIDGSYSRIHNYASAVPLYKNMAVVSAVCIVAYALRQQWIFCAVSAAAAVLFVHRWRRFEIKKILYTVSWYAQKYSKG